MATAKPRGRAIGRAPKGAFSRAGNETKASYAQFNALAKGRDAKGARGGAKALRGDGGG